MKIKVLLNKEEKKFRNNKNKLYNRNKECKIKN